MIDFAGTSIKCSYFIKRRYPIEKKIIIILVCLTILGGSLSNVFAESASFQTFSENEIKNANKYIINHNNQLVINDKNALIREVGTQKYSLIVNDLELCNYLISNGKINIKKMELYISMMMTVLPYKAATSMLLDYIGGDGIDITITETLKILSKNLENNPNIQIQ